MSEYRNGMWAGLHRPDNASRDDMEKWRVKVRGTTPSSPENAGQFSRERTRSVGKEQGEVMAGPIMDMISGATSVEVGAD